MRTVEDVAKFVGGQPHLMALLRAVETLAIDDCWIGAGAIRNAVWDHLHDYPIQLAAGSDVDVVYLDSLKVHPEIDLERRLTKNWPSIPWSVCNQARMHERNGDPPYRDTEDAVRCWPETATAVAARLRGGRVQIIAPHSVDDLVHRNVRPTPVFRKKLNLLWSTAPESACQCYSATRIDGQPRDPEPRPSAVSGDSADGEAAPAVARRTGA